MSDALHSRSSLTPDKCAAAMADGSAAISYRQLDERADRMAALLQHLGLTGGDTIALLHDNELSVLEWWWGARRAGLYYVPLGTKLTPTELAYIVRDCGASLVLASGALAALAGNLQTLIPGVPMIVSGPGMDRAASLDDRLAALDHPTPFPAAVVGRELIYSSGTTGKPKGIRRALAPADQGARLPELEIQMRKVFQIDADTVYLSVSPLYHAVGRFLNRVIESGGSVVIAPKFDPELALAAIARHRITHSQWVPTMFSRLLALPRAVRDKYDLSSHRVALHAAAPCPIGIKREMIEWWGPIVDDYYGGTENAGVTFIAAREWLDHPGSVGRSITGAIHILDEDGSERELAPGEIGLIYFEGGLPFAYLNRAPGDAPTHSTRGYATYGDLGHVDEAGYLFVSDRRSDLIISGGVNIYPKEIELVLEVHPAVAEAAVIGVPDTEFGQRVKAVIRLADGQTPSAHLVSELERHCRAHLSGIKCPRGIDFVDDFPRNESGKLLKRELRDRYGAASP